MLCLLLIVIVTVLGGHVTRCAGDEHPYTVEIDNFEISTAYDQKYVNWDTLGLQKKGRNKFVIGGTFSLNRNLANEQKIMVQVFTYNKDTKTKGPIVFNMEKAICKFIKEDKDIYPGLREKSNFPPADTCPIPKNEYTIEDYEMTADFLPDNIPRGDYLAVFLLKDGFSVVAGFTSVVNISD